MKLTDFGMITSLAIIVSVALLLSLEPAYAQTADYTDRTSENLFTFHQDRSGTGGIVNRDLGLLPILSNQDIVYTNVTLGSSGDGPYTNPYVSVRYAGTSTVSGVFAIQQIDVTVPKGFTTSGSTTTQQFPSSFYHSFDCDEDRTEVHDGFASPIFASEYDYNFNILPYVRQITLTNTDGTTNSPAGDLLDYNVCIAPEGLHDNHNYIDIPTGSPDRFVNAYTPPTGWSVTPESASTVTIIQPDPGSAIEHYARIVLTPAAGDSTNINATGNELIAEATSFIRYNPISGNPAPNGIDTLSFEAPFFDAVIAIPTTADTPAIFGSMGSENGQFDDPRGIAVNSTHIMVVDRDNDRVQTLVYSGTYVDQFGSRGTSNGEFTTPQGITTNSTHILVADQQNHRIQTFDYSGTYVGQFGGTGTGNGQFDSPNGITTNSTHILVADSNNHRIQILDHSGNYVSEFGGTGTGNGQFDTPHGITTTPTNILVADSNNDRIQIFDYSGNYVSEFGGTGTGDGEFDRPRGIAVTTTHILVTDELNHRIQTFDLAGNYVRQFGSMGTGDGQFNNPYGIDIEGNNVFVSDTGNHRVHIYALATLVPPENTGGGSGGNIAQSRPHFGLSPLTDTQLVSCGFSMDGICRDVVDYHVPYERTTIQTGTTHDFTLKPFNNYSLKMLQLGLGVEEVGDSINTAEALIVIELEPDYKSDIGYTIKSVETENNLEDVIDEVTESNVSLSTEQCMPGLKKDCLVVHINDVMFRDVFYSEPFVINVVDTKRLSSTNYLNEGIIVTGESLNPAPEYHLTTGKKVQQVVERLNLVRTDKVNDIWTDNNGNQWTQNSHDTWIQVTFTPYVEPQDPAMSVMTRINNNFDDIIQKERERAILVWDGAMIQGEIKPSFSYTFDEKLDKLDDPKILKKMHIESEKALEILRAANYHFQDE